MAPMKEIQAGARQPNKSPHRGVRLDGQSYRQSSLTALALSFITDSNEVCFLM
jgi:hypothetical protein